MDNVNLFIVDVLDIALVIDVDAIILS